MTAASDNDDPFGWPMLTDEEKRQQITDRDALVQAAIMAVDMFSMAHRADKATLPEAVWVRLLLQAGIGLLLAEKLVDSLITDDTFEVHVRLPEHLVPDVAAEHRRRK